MWVSVYIVQEMSHTCSIVLMVFYHLGNGLKKVVFCQIIQPICADVNEIMPYSSIHLTGNICRCELRKSDDYRMWSKLNVYMGGFLDLH